MMWVSCGSIYWITSTWWFTDEFDSYLLGFVTCTGIPKDTDPWQFGAKKSGHKRTNKLASTFWRNLKKLLNQSNGSINLIAVRSRLRFCRFRLGICARAFAPRHLRPTFFSRSGANDKSASDSAPQSNFQCEMSWELLMAWMNLVFDKREKVAANWISSLEPSLS